MLTYKLVNNLKESEDHLWQELVRKSLGNDVHPSRKKGFCLARQALRLCVLDFGQELAVGQLQLENYRHLNASPSLTVSLSHTAEWGAAIAANQKQYVSVGIDLEPSQRIVKSAILERITHPQDAKLQPILVWALKEACFKALMNTGRFDSNEEFSSIIISDKCWAHPSSGIKGEWKSEEQEGMTVAMAWIRT